VNSAPAVRVEDPSTTALSAANAATRAWTARLLTAQGLPRLVNQRGGGVGEQGVQPADEPDMVALGVLAALSGDKRPTEPGKQI
jgi:hypothetical protein